METGKSPIEEFKGKEISIDFRNNTFQGIVDIVNYESGYVDLRPSVTFSFDGSRAKFENEIPTRLSLKLFEKDVLYAITPHPQGYLEQRVNAVNNPPKKEMLGFRA